MGLFDAIFGKSVKSAAKKAVKQAAEKAVATAASAAMKKIESIGDDDAPNQPSNLPTMSFDGDNEGRCYVYDARNVPRLKVGQTFRADVVPCDVTITSAHTGTETSTKGFCSALSYGGKIFGSTSSPLECLKEVAASGYHVTVEVKRTGTYSKGIPELAVMTADPPAIRGWWLTCQSLGEIVPFDDAERRIFEVNVDEDRAGDIDDGPIELSLEYIPWKSKKAKSPMVIAVMIDGEKVATISNGARAYDSAALHIGEEPANAIAKRLPSYSGGYYWKIIAVYD